VRLPLVSISIAGQSPANFLEGPLRAASSVAPSDALLVGTMQAAETPEVQSPDNFLEGPVRVTSSVATSDALLLDAMLAAETTSDTLLVKSVVVEEIEQDLGSRWPANSSSTSVNILCDYVSGYRDKPIIID
jgi:hypothetical protein